ncbi:hypothetical protein [Demequina litorisediminis]|uniref:Uncharacterized protein n=1 Tax=Demequina litorisediminis TaxID=1849022 RepID=A0ABQ6I852_9MICO|nr:hypothetical protein [Demequina litorisediminis]GMA33881.1 hypothetical protein GCM10025876_00850 [Demequina litorisediminis]
MEINRRALWIAAGTLGVVAVGTGVAVADNAINPDADDAPLEQTAVDQTPTSGPVVQALRVAGGAGEQGDSALGAYRTERSADGEPAADGSGYAGRVGAEHSHARDARVRGEREVACDASVHEDSGHAAVDEVAGHAAVDEVARDAAVHQDPRHPAVREDRTVRAVRQLGGTPTSPFIRERQALHKT